MAILILPLLAVDRAELESRYWTHVVKHDGCWAWKGRKTSSGYGKFAYGHAREMAAHRFSYALHYGVEPGGLLVCHRCDNPECTNPNHLFLGTNKDNSDDKIAKGRLYVGDHSGERNGRALITEDDARYIRIASMAGMANMELGRLFGIHHSMVSMIKRGKSWTHVDIAG